ncbi:hypothetical protein I4U23_023297 [Adineta vaga]|nr:hypothetical protein I4U23_023297 [Adineta vaga]
MIQMNESEEVHLGYHFYRIFDINDEPLCDLPPLDDLEEIPIVSLENAVEPLRSWSPLIYNFAKYLKTKCPRPPPDGLTVDESTSIMLYTTGWLPINECLYSGLNEALRSKDREKLKPWFLYLKLLFTALARLPPVEGNIYRAVKLDLTERYSIGQRVTWSGFSSCTNIMNILHSVVFSNLTKKRLLFNIKCKTARNITKHSSFQGDDEILLLPGTQFKCQNSFHRSDNFCVIELEEISIPSSLEKLFGGKTTSIVIVDDPKSVSDKTKSNQIEKSNSVVETNVSENKRWIQDGDTIAGGNGLGKDLNQLFLPTSFCMDNDRTFYIADSCNNRIVEWNCGATSGQVVAGGAESGSSVHLLDGPSDVILDAEGQHLFICDAGNRRIVQWPRKNGKHGKILFSNFNWQRLTMDKNGYFYLSDSRNSIITRWKPDDTSGFYIAGKDEAGSRHDQLDNPTSIFVDVNHSVYISDTNNHRIMKWPEGATEGILVAGGNGKGSDLNQLDTPRKVFVDDSENIYVADTDNHRIVCWPKEAKQGYIIVGGNDEGNGKNQLRYPKDFLFDQEKNLYVLDSGNHRIQQFHLDRN